MKNFSEAEAAAIHASLADGQAECSASGDLRTFLRMGMQYEPSNCVYPSLEEFATSRDEKLSGAAIALINASQTYEGLFAAFLVHAEHCEICGCNVHKHSDLIEARRPKR